MGWNAQQGFSPRDLLAGLNAACVTLPLGLTAGILVYAPMGPEYYAQGAAAGLLTTIVAGALAALFSSSSFIIVGPLASTSIIPAALTAYLMNEATFARAPHFIVLAIAICIILSGLLQIIFGVLNLGRVIKFTPHSVIAGFINSVGFLIILSQIRPYFRFEEETPGFVRIEHPAQLLFVIALAVCIAIFRDNFKRLPAPLFGLFVGTLGFYGLHYLFPDLPLGQTIGKLPFSFPPSSPLWTLGDAQARAALFSVGPHLLLISLTLAAVATLQSLLAFRVAQNLAQLPPRPPRDLVAQGLANFASGLTGGIMALTTAAPTDASFRAGGHTRIAGITNAIITLLIVALFSSTLAAIPVVVLSAILVSIGYQVLDRWTFRLFRDAYSKRLGVNRSHARQDLSVVLLVMAVSVASTIVAGAIAGVVLSCLIFIVNMTRPIIRRHYFGDQIFSKRSRPRDDIAFLLRTARERAVLELQGVLFFGNADDLSNLVNEMLKESKMVLLDMRGISAVDVSGATVLANMVTRAKARGCTIILCNVSSSRLDTTSIAKESIIFPDLDSALECMENESLRAAAARPADEAIPLAALDLTREFDADEIELLRSLLTPREFEPGKVICSESEDADRMWVLTKGSVSVNLRAESGFRRIASLTAGTTVGEMAMLEGAARSATITADGEVSSYELSREAFATIRREHPVLALKVITYFAQEMTRRLRQSNLDLRGAN